MNKTKTRSKFAYILPALIFVAALDILYLGGGWWLKRFLEVNALLWSALMVCFPLLALIQRRLSLRDLGFGDPQVRVYVFGALVGAGWRVLDLVLTQMPLQTHSATLWSPPYVWMALLNGLIVVPLIEEIFFRVFLQAGLRERFGPGVAIVAQALLFALHPAHLAQESFHLGLFVVFGLIAGILYERTQSIYALIGAHGIANVLPILVYWLDAWWWNTDLAFR